MEPKQTILKASAIKCNGCAAAARAAVGRVAGVHGALVSVPEQTVTVVHRPDTPRRELADALTRAGFPAE